MLRPAMTLIAQLLSLANTYEAATGIGRTTLSWRVFSDTKKLQSLHDGKDIQTKRLESAIAWFSANWPEGADWPESISRPKEAAV